MILRHATLFSLAATLLVGCQLPKILPDPAPPPSVYRLDVPSPVAEKRIDAVVVRVDNPSASRTFNTRDVLVVTSDGTLSAASMAQWSDSVPELIQTAALNSLGASDRYITVVPVAGTRSDWRLHLDIREFAATYDQGDMGAPIARTRVYATIANAATREFLASKDLVGEERASGNRVSAIVAAQSMATEEAMQNLVDWMDSLNSES